MTKSRFLRVEGSAWELKIDGKRFHGVICLAMRVPGELLGAVEGSLGAQGCLKIKI